jgi:hypothetical protein
MNPQDIELGVALHYYSEAILSGDNDKIVNTNQTLYQILYGMHESGRKTVGLKEFPITDVLEDLQKQAVHYSQLDYAQLNNPEETA